LFVIVISPLKNVAYSSLAQLFLLLSKKLKDTYYFCTNKNSQIGLVAPHAQNLNLLASGLHTTL